MHRVRTQIGLSDEISRKWNGEEVNVAILDTGIVRHPDFGNRIMDFKDFVNKRHDTSGYDDSGHGTHVAGCLAGNGFLCNGKYRGVAPKSNLVIGKVLDNNGDGSVQNMIDGIEWILSIRKQKKIKVLNISVGVGKIENELYKENLKKIIKEAWESGIIVIAAAGNGGPSPMSISPIASSNYCITVGCHDGNYKCDHLCERYSARGPSIENIKKPDIVAPGTDIISCSREFRWQTRDREEAYTKKSGTSMATPIIAGAVALLIQKDKMSDNEEIKRKLLYSAKDMGEPWSKQGWGMVDITKMLNVSDNN